MSFDFAIAYADRDGRDFKGIPWIFDDVDNEKECVSRSLEMIASGFRKVIPFKFDREKEKAEEFDWTYVEGHRI